MSDPHAEFIEVACVPVDGWHASGSLDEAEAILAVYPDVAAASIHAAAIVGDDVTVRRFLETDPELATAKGGPRGWDALTHLCFSRYLRLDRARSDGFVDAARGLLDAGADPNTGWHEPSHEPDPVWESALYGAAGVAHHERLTRLLLERGADPNDDEVLYHTPETRENGALEALLETGRVEADGLAMMLVRKADWHDEEGVALLLAAGAEPNRRTRWGYTALHQAVRRDNGLAVIERMLEYGADVNVAAASDRAPSDVGLSAAAIAARRGRADVLDALDRRRIGAHLAEVDRLAAACARGDVDGVRALEERDPGTVDELLRLGGVLLAGFAGNGNTPGVRHLLELGVDVEATHDPDDGYWGLAAGSTALHVAAWRARHDTVKVLVERGAVVDARDGRGRTPLTLAVRACVDSYWTGLRAPDSVEALLGAGASVEGVSFPSGYDEVDALLRAHGARPDTT